LDILQKNKQLGIKMLKDRFGRVVDYLRVSVTERCNFRCNYCMPDKPFSWKPKEKLLSFEELFEFIQLGIDSGINKVRITGGEPLLREGLDDFIKMISEYNSDVDLALTTNGFLLKELAPKLKSAGLKRINISLDSLNEATAGKIANKNVLQNVLDGIQKAQDVGLKVKLNSVPLKGINEAEIIALLEFAKDKNMPIRYIEYMENSFADPNLKGLNSTQILENIASKYRFTKVIKDDSSPAQYYRLEDGYEFGIIEPHKDDFCKSCNRMRLTAEGDLIPCLYFDESLSIADAIKEQDLEKAKGILDELLANKPEKNRWEEGNTEVSSRAFYETGG
jgi:cyclic pyranopterin phosphate synthase